MKLQRWILASRPKTLLAGLSPVAIGTALAAHDGGWALMPALAALIGAIAIQIGTNFCNDYCDFFQGADTAERKGPTRAVQAGWISPPAMLAATFLMFGIALAAAAYLTARAGWPFLVIGLLGTLFGILYTAGRYSLAYLGLGDPFVFVFFGPVAVAGTHYVQTLSLSTSAVVSGFAPGLIAVGLLVVNNLRDTDEDRAAGKRTLAVRFGATFSRWQYTVCVVAASLIPVVTWYMGLPLTVLAASLTLIPAIFVSREVWLGQGRELLPALGKTAGLLLLFTVLFCGGLLIGAPS